ncbi:MAG: hypothetical protein ACRYFU_15370 [Janthinobacterium lividum]
MGYLLKRRYAVRVSVNNRVGADVPAPKPTVAKLVVWQAASVLFRSWITGETEAIFFQDLNFTNANQRWGALFIAGLLEGFC